MQADVCLIAEGGYPYLLGGVSSWMDSLMRASPQLRFHLIAISISSQPRVRKFTLPPNAVGVTDVILDRCPAGRRPAGRDRQTIAEGVALIQSALTRDDGTGFARLIDLIARTGLVQRALLDSKPAWSAMQRAYTELMPDGPLIDFFWSWRFLARSLLAITTAELPDVGVFHSVSTGYAGLVGAYAAYVTKRPFVVTEHGIYTNERRIELSTASWLFDSGAGGFAVGDKPKQLLDVWLDAFSAFSRIAYHHADIITTQYGANQNAQRLDGAPPEKFAIIPNGIDVDFYGSLERCHEARPPTVVMVGRIVPIKDTRTFISAIALLRKLVPDVVAILIGPEEEDPEYAAGCRALVDQLGIGSNVRFLGRVPDVNHYLVRADVVALTSISEAQPIALLEAAAIGLPAVTTDVGSCRDILEGFDGDPVVGRGGIVVDACNPRATADALAAILLDPEGRAKMGEVMRRRAANLYNKHRIRGLYEALYAGLPSRTAPPCAA